MPRSLVAAVAVAAVLVSACGNGQTVPVETVTPDVATSTPTPSREELVAEAERVYRTFFEEWKRLERAGGADEPTQILRDNADGEYLEFVTGLLREQKESGTAVSGNAIAKVVSAPGGEDAGVDPRLTLAVCEDYTRGTVTRDGVTHPGDMVQGTVYLGWVEGRMKLLYADTDAVDTCTL